MNNLREAAAEARDALEALHWGLEPKSVLARDLSKRIDNLKAALELELPATELSVGIDWGTAGERPCCTVIKKLPNGAVELVACEYGPLSNSNIKNEKMVKQRTTGWPGWEDSGRQVQVEYENGSIVQGELFIEDFFPSGEGDEVPVFQVLDGAGNKHSFGMNKRWQWADLCSCGDRQLSECPGECEPGCGSRV